MIRIEGEGGAGAEVGEESRELQRASRRNRNIQLPGEGIGVTSRKFQRPEMEEAPETQCR